VREREGKVKETRFATPKIKNKFKYARFLKQNKNKLYFIACFLFYFLIERNVEIFLIYFYF